MHLIECLMESKKSTQLPFSLEIVQDSDEELVLIAKIPNAKQFAKYDSLKQCIKYSRNCVRIDLPSCQPWWQVTGVGDCYVNKNFYEANTSQIAIKKARAIFATLDMPAPICEILIGKRTMTKKKQQKLSVYSPKAAFLLSDCQKVANVTIKDMQRFQNGIVTAVEVFHSLRFVINDIKSYNILVFKNEQGYFIKLAGFMNVLPFDREEPLTMFGFESPEVIYAHRASKIFGYYHRQKDLSYGMYIYRKLKFDAQNKGLLLNHPSNDMWSLGIVFYLLFFGKKMEDIFNNADKMEKETHPIIRGLLNPIRERRWSIAELKSALQLFHQQQSFTCKELTQVPKDSTATFLPLYANFAQPTDKGTSQEPDLKVQKNPIYEKYVP